MSTPTDKQRDRYRPGLVGYLAHLRDEGGTIWQRLRPSDRLRRANADARFWEWAAETPTVDHTDACATTAVRDYKLRARAVLLELHEQSVSSARGKALREAMETLEATEQGGYTP